jgi:uncharacterized protein
MAENPNIALVKSGFDAFAKGDVATMTQLLDENVLWHSYPGKSQISGDFKGRGDTLALFAKMFELSAGTVAVKILDIAASDDNVYVQIATEATRDGQTRKSGGVMRFHVDASGKSTEVWAYGEDPAADDAFWS